MLIVYSLVCQIMHNLAIIIEHLMRISYLNHILAVVLFCDSFFLHEGLTLIIRILLLQRYLSELLHHFLLV